MNKICLTTWIVLCCALRASAFSTYLSSFNSRYGTAGTPLDSCFLCHIGNPNLGPPQSNRNSYGADFEGQPHAGAAAVLAAFANIENLNSDGNGGNNITEINNRTFPGDPNDPPPDITAPSVSITNPSNGTSYSTAQTVTLQATASDNVGVTKVEFYDGATLRGTDASAPYSFGWTFTSADNGSHAWTARAYDAAGNNQASAAVNLTVNIDVTPPSVTITTPPNGTSYSTAQTVTLQATASDNVGVSKVEFYDGATLRGTDVSAPYSFDWAFTSADNGSHAWTARAYDAAGNNQGSSAINLTVNIDVTPPSVTITAPANGTSYSTVQTVTLQATASDNVGVSKVEFYDGATLRGTVNSGPYNFNWTIAFADNGSHAWTARAYDAAGNNQTSAGVNLTVNIPPPSDTTLPSVSITTPPNGTSYSTPQTVTLQASASDNVGVTKVEFYDGGTLRGTDASAPYGFDWAFSSADNGSHAWTARAYDAAGNNQTSLAVNLTVNIPPPSDTTPPSVSITTPPNGTTYTASQTVTLQAAASDNVGVTRVEFYDGATLRLTDSSAPYSFDWTFTSADNGPHAWTARAYDAAGNNQASSAVNLTVNIVGPPSDVTPPSVTLTAPLDGTSYSTAQTVTLQAAAGDNVGVTRVEFYDGATLRGTDTGSPYSFDWTVTSGDNGPHAWTARAYDAAGNNQTSPAVNLAVNIVVPPIDVTPPNVAISAPPNGTSYSTAQTVTLQASASDDVGVTKVEFYDGATLRSIVTSAPYNFDWTFTGADNGSHVWVARAYDAAGNNLTSLAVTLTLNIVVVIDVTPPSVAMTALPNGPSYSSPQTVTLQAVASDNVGVTKVEFYDGGALRGTDTSAPYSFDWTFNAADNGPHAWTARAYDAAGNTQTSPPLNLTVNVVGPVIDLTPPAVTITAPPNGTSYGLSQTVTIQAAASDNVGVTQVEFYDGGTLRGAVTSPPYSLDWTFTATENGSHAWTARAYDAAGNQQTSPALNLSVNIVLPGIDVTPPNISLTAPPDGSSYNTPQTVRLQAAASDNVAVTQVEFYDGGILRGTDTRAPFIFDWKFTSVDNGSHTWTVGAYDAAGNHQTSPAFILTVNIDVTPPSVTITAPLSGARFTAPQTVTLHADASDNAGVAKVEFYDGGTLRGTDTSAPYSFDWTFTSDDKGPHAWTARAYDAAGSSRTSTAVNLTVDVSPPSLAVTRSGSNLTIIWTSSVPGFVLQQATSLGSNGSWTDVLIPPTVNGTLNTVTLVLSVTPLQVTPSGGEVTLNWVGDNMLQEADSIFGPWTDLAGASSPHTIEPTGLAAFYRLSAQGFYRLRSP